MRWFELFFAVIPIKVSLKMFLFSDVFIERMIYPSLALFLGTGNATPGESYRTSFCEGQKFDA